LVENLEENLSLVIEKFAHLTKNIFHLNNPHLILSCERKTFDELIDKKFYGLTKFSDASGSFQPWVEFAHPKPVHSMIKHLATPIAHNAQSIATVNMNSPYAHALKIASYLFENLEIHLRVREQGGAYSSGVKFNILIGNYQFFSSRDPNILSTYAAFESAVARIANGQFSDRDLQEACLSYIQDVDRVVSPGSRASVTYYQNKVGLTKEIRQEFRDKILKTTKEEIVNAVRECLSPKMKAHSVRVSYANKELYERDAPKFKEAGYPELLEIST
jgi:Zn-dependent M16 (insulinase) family peptidase